ncbi:DUF475 domain-containing protein [bacterium]|nr:DUF475 domain-containing protein [bacterium]
MKHFWGSYIFAAVGFIFAYLWGEHVHSGTGLACVFITFVLSVLEVSLSFDNAVVNAMKLEKMSPVWQHRFLTWGILIAVFGMRLLFPILVVTMFAQLAPTDVIQMALTDSDKYAHYLHLTHAPIVTFGGAFLMMLFLSYFFNGEKEVHWINSVEKHFAKVGDIKGLEILIVLLCIFLLQFQLVPQNRLSVLTAGLIGIVTYLCIDGLSNWLEAKEHVSVIAKGSGLASFLYLELIDASFSLDGVLGAFALSRDVLIITIGLAIGAFFVRSLTLLMVEKKTLAQFIYLEHGAHWAIGALSILMFISTFKEVPEVITGMTGLVFIIGALISSIIYNKNNSQI